MAVSGIKMAVRTFPEGFVTGTPPFSLTGVKPKAIKPADQSNFLNEDINKIEIYLENAMEDHSVGST